YAIERDIGVGVDENRAAQTGTAATAAASIAAVSANRSGIFNGEIAQRNVNRSAGTVSNNQTAIAAGVNRSARNSDTGSGNRRQVAGESDVITIEINGVRPGEGVGA